MSRTRPSLLAIAAVVLGVFSGSNVEGQGCAQWQIAQVAPPSTGLAAVTWANGEFWAFGGGGGGTEYGSTTGTVWTGLGTAPAWELVQVRWTGSSFVALGDEGRLATSADGLSWTLRVDVGGIPSTTLSDLAWNGSTYVAVGFNATESSGAYGYPLIIVSPDLVTWTGVNPPAGGSAWEELSGIVWTGTRFVAVGQTQTGGGVGKIVFVSNDGLSWTRLSGPGGGSVAWSGRELVAVGGYFTGGPSVVWRSADGLTWQSATLDQAYNLSAVVWDGSRFIAVGGASILVSQDGSTWQAQTLTISDTLVGVAGYGGTDVAIGQHGAIAAANCPGANVVWVPVASHTSGLNNSQWRSDLGLLNPGSVAANAQMVFYGSGGPEGSTTSVPAGAQSILSDVVGQLNASGSGALEILSDQPLKVTARTYNQVASAATCYPNGTQGQDYPAVTTGGGLGAGQSAYLPGLTENASYRCNIGVVNTGTGNATVLVTLFDGAGDNLGNYTVSLASGQWAQATQPFLNVGGQTAMDRGYATIAVQSGSGVFGFASVIDNITNDPTTVSMQR